MKDWFRGPRGGLAAFVLISGLVAGGLGWATAAALRLEREQLAERVKYERTNTLNLALWRLDSRVSPLLAREDNRAFDHYSTIYAPPLVLSNLGTCQTPGTVLELSPLLSAELPEWMLLHFQLDAETGWESPQAPADSLKRRLTDLHLRGLLTNMTEQRRQLLAELKQALPAAQLLAVARERTAPATLRDTTLMVARQQLQQLENPVNAANPVGSPVPSSGGALNPYLNQQPQQMPNQPASQVAAPLGNYANNEFGARTAFQYKFKEENTKTPQKVPRDMAQNTTRGGEEWLLSKDKKNDLKQQKEVKKEPVSAELTVNLSPLVPLWVQSRKGDEKLLLLRMVHIDEREVCQGIVLDGEGLQELLARSVSDLFPEASLVPVREVIPEQSERAMTALPFLLDPGASADAVLEPGCTPLRVGLTLAWTAAGIALLAVALGGWSLLDLSERRIRFVSAVTHELRTPLTTLRLYLDMLLGGLVRDEQQRQEYIQTLNAEAERLNRLVGNVLDFSRLEKQRPRLNHKHVPVADLLAQVQATWQGRCHDAAKELVVENTLVGEVLLWTDPELVQQVLSNLLDNACKYSQGAADARLWLRVRAAKRGVAFEVEDRGPGVAPAERRSIFRAFRRGRHADVTAGGVGLGLALAHRWTHLLGGRLSLLAPHASGGACFQLLLPA